VITQLVKIWQIDQHLKLISMTKRDLIQKILLGGTTLVLLLTSLNSCSKEEEKQEENNITIDLNDVKYANLKNSGVTAIVNDIIIANYQGSYYGAEADCPSCGGAINFVFIVDPSWWKCSNCKSGFDEHGIVVTGPSFSTLRTYIVTRSGDILTIHT
jgi:nitrite reductase/ring-hydroxylating ferredoxin subunit